MFMLMVAVDTPVHTSTHLVVYLFTCKRMGQCTDKHPAHEVCTQHAAWVRPSEHVGVG